MESEIWNIKPRLLWCPQCKIDTINNFSNPRCQMCGNNLLTVLYSMMDGSRITGVKS